MEESQQSALQIEALVKSFPGRVRALNGVSLTIPHGLFGLLGPNGAGKTTLMRILATLQEPDSGSVRLGELDVLRQKDEVRALLGYLLQEFGFYPNLSGEEMLDHFARLKGLGSTQRRRPEVQRLLAQVNLYDNRRKPVGGYSGGMRQRLGIAIALLGAPRLVIVDEPTAGLDPTERHRFLNLLAEVGEEATVILSTHIVEDVRELCERMAILAYGQVVAQGDPETVIEAVRGRIWSRTIGKGELPEFEAKYRIVSKRLIAGRPTISVYSEEDPGAGFRQVEADLTDAYFFFTAPPKEPVVPKAEEA